MHLDSYDGARSIPFQKLKVSPYHEQVYYSKPYRDEDVTYSNMAHGASYSPYAGYAQA